MTLVPPIIAEAFVGRIDPEDIGPYAAWLAAVSTCPTDVQDILKRTHDRANEAASTQLLAVSPASAPLILLWFFVPTFKTAIKNRVRRVEDDAVRADEIGTAMAV
jgi:hypothetical protein